MAGLTASAGRGQPPAVRASWVGAALLLGTAAVRAGEPEESLGALEPPLPLGGVPMGAVESYGPEEYVLPAMRFDLSAGAVVPNEGSGMAFGQGVSNENFFAGGFVGFRFQAEVADWVYAGAEVDFAAHDVDTGDVFFDGTLSRVYFLAPVTLAVPLERGRVPAELDFSLGPGFQVVIPEVDSTTRNRLEAVGEFIDDEDFVAFTLRAAVTFRVALSPYVSLFSEVAYDFAVGEADLKVWGLGGTVIEDRSDEVNLEALHVLLGVSWRF